jgi:adenine phosphoribosyltransferase
MGTESKGMMLAALVGLHLGVGIAEVRKEPERGSDDDQWLTARTRPDYRDRTLSMGVSRSQLGAGDRVLFVDDWVATGGQMKACHQLVEMGRAHWLGAAVVVDGLEQSVDRRNYNVRSLVHLREL